MKTLKANWALVVGLAIPVLLIGIIAVLIFIPRMMSDSTPGYDFIYSVGEGVVYPSEYPYMSAPIKPYPLTNGTWPKYSYLVQNGVVTRVENAMPDKEFGAIVSIDPSPKFYRYNVANSSSTLIEYDALHLITLDTNLVSPDGYQIERGRMSGQMFPFFFDQPSYDNIYLKKGADVRQINLEIPKQSYYQQFFIGWITK